MLNLEYVSYSQSRWKSSVDDVALTRKINVIWWSWLRGKAASLATSLHMLDMQVKPVWFIVIMFKYATLIIKNEMLNCVNNGLT